MSRVYMASCICGAHFKKCSANKSILSGNPLCLQFFHATPLACNLSDLPVLHNKDDDLKDANEDKKLVHFLLTNQSAERKKKSSKLGSRNFSNQSIKQVYF